MQADDDCPRMHSHIVHVIASSERAAAVALHDASRGAVHVRRARHGDFDNCTVARVSHIHAIAHSHGILKRQHERSKKRRLEMGATRIRKRCNN